MINVENFLPSVSAKGPINFDFKSVKHIKLSFKSKSKSPLPIVEIAFPGGASFK